MIFDYKLIEKIIWNRKITGPTLLLTTSIRQPTKITLGKVSSMLSLVSTITTIPTMLLLPPNPFQNLAILIIFSEPKRLSLPLMPTNQKQTSVPSPEKWIENLEPPSLMRPLPRTSKIKYLDLEPT
jgi:hypothetical protein